MKNSSSEIRRRNRTSALRELLHCEKLTKPELAVRLKLSLPTAGQLMEELETQGLVRESGLAESAGGRRAMYYEAQKNSRLAIGADITRNHLRLALLNLAGEVQDTRRIRLAFANDEAYRQRLRQELEAFLNKNQVMKTALVGVGYSLPGIVSADRQRLTLSHILGIMEPETFAPAHWPDCPYQCFNDADAACIRECYDREDMTDFAFLSLSDTVGGALVLNGEIQRGLNGRCGEIGHMRVEAGPGARMGDGGRRGHYDPYGSAERLAEQADGSLELFFQRLEQGDLPARQVFEEYLDRLAAVVQNLAVFTDMDVVIGGYVGHYLGPYLDRLREKVDGMDSRQFASARHIRLCRHGVDAAAAGSALPLIRQFIQTV